MPTAPTPLPEPALMLDVTAVARLIDISTRQVWRLADAGGFPRPVSVGSRLKRWPRAVVLAWIEAQMPANPRR